MSDRGALIFGSEGFGREVAALLCDIGHSVRGFISPSPPTDQVLPAPWLGDESVVREMVRVGTPTGYLAIGDMAIRQKVHLEMSRLGVEFPGLVHPSAVLLSEHPIGEAVVVYPGVVVLNGCRIGKGVLLNSACSLGHDVWVGDFSNINPGARVAGSVRIGAGSLLGIGCSVREKVVIGEGAVVGAGSVVIRDVPSGAMVYGVPAHKGNHG